MAIDLNLRVLKGKSFNNKNVDRIIKTANMDTQKNNEFGYSYGLFGNGIQNK